MTLRAIAGLGALNAVFLVTGLALVWALRGLARWTTVARLAGLAYLLGTAALGTAWTVLLVVGVPFGVPTVVLTAAVVTGGALVAGRRLGRAVPSDGPSGAPTRAALVAAAGVALAGVFLEALFRVARLQGLYAFDGWAFWVPKGKAIYFFGGLDEQLFTSLPGPTYPPLVPILDAAAFHAMGGADTVTLHLQYWFLAVGFVAAVAGLLWRHVPAWLLWPSLLLALVVPRASTKLLTPQADFPVDYLVVAAAVLVALWLLDGQGWRLVGATILLGAAANTKREGILLAACLYVAALVATSPRLRSAWPRLLASALAVGLAALPWRLWYASHGVGGETPAGGGIGSGLDRAGEALRLSLDVAFDAELWSVILPVAVAAVALAALWGRRSLAAYAGVLLALVVVGGGWITLAYPDLPVTADEALNPIVRYTGSLALLAACLTPLLLAGAWRGEGRT